MFARLQKKRERETLTRLRKAFDPLIFYTIRTSFYFVGLEKVFEAALARENFDEAKKSYVAALTDGSFKANGHDLNQLRLTDTFYRAARSVNYHPRKMNTTDEWLASYLKEETKKKDIAFLEKKHMPALAAVLKAKYRV